MVDRQKELYHQQLAAQAQAAQAAWLRGNGYSQHSGFPSGGSHGNTPVNPYENLMLQNIMGASNLLGNAANKDRAGFPSPFSFPGQFAQFGYQRPMAAHSANMKAASSSNPLAAHMISNPYQYPANYYGMNPNYLHAGESGGSGASAAGSSSAVAAMNNYMNRSAAASSPAPTSDRFRQQFEANSVERDSSRRGRGAQASTASVRSSSLNGGSGMTAEANAAFNLQQLQAAYNQAAALNSNAGHSSSSTESPAASNKSKSSSYPNYFPGGAQSTTQSGQGFGSSNTSGTDINDHIAKEVMKTFGDSWTPQLLRQMQLSSMQHEAAAAAANPSHKSTPDLSKDSRKAGAYPSVGSASSAASMQAAAAAANSNQSRYSNQYRQQQDMKASYTSQQQQQQQQQHQQQQQAMRASAMVSAAAAAAARGHSGSNSTPADPTANINSLMMEYLGGAAASSYPSPSAANKNNNQRPGVSSNTSTLQDYSNPLPQQYGNPREMVDNYFKSHANMGQSAPSNAPSMESVQQRQQQQQSSAQQREAAPQNLMAENQRLSAQTATKHNQSIDNNGYQHHQNLIQQQQQHNMNQQQVEQHKQSQHKMLSPPDTGHTQPSQPSPMHSFQQSLSPANLHTSPGQTLSPSQPSPAAHVSPMGPSPSHPGPSPSHPGPSPSHPGPSPSHPGPSPSHPGPSPSHPGPSPSYTGPSPAYTGPSPSHPGPSPSQLSPSPTNIGLSPSPAHPGPSPSGPSPSYTGPSPSHPGPSPSYTGPSSSYGGPSPSHPGPSPNSHVSPSMPGDNITSPSTGQVPYSPNNIDPKMSPYSQAASPYSQNTNKRSPYSQPSPRMSPYSQQSPRMSPYSGMSPYSQHSPQMPSYSQPSPQMLPSYSQTSPKVNSYSSVSPVYHGNHLGAPQTSPSYHPRPPSPMNSLPIMETNVTEISSKSSLDIRSSPEPPLNKPIINEISLSKKCSNDSPRLDTPPGLALPPQHIEEEKVEKAVVEEKKDYQDSKKPIEPEIVESKDSEEKVTNGKDVDAKDSTTKPINNSSATTTIPAPAISTTMTTKPTHTLTTTTTTIKPTNTTNTTTTVSTATTTTTTTSTTSSSSGLSNISSMTNKIKLLESKMHSAKNKTNQERSSVEDNSLKKWWKPQQLVKETLKPSPAVSVQPSNSQQKSLLSPSLPESSIQQDLITHKLSGDNQKENSSALVNTDNDNANDELDIFSTNSEKSLGKEKLSSKSERKHNKKSYQKESKRSRESSEPRDSFVDDSRELSRQRIKIKDLSPSPVPEIDSFYSPVKKKSSLHSPVTKKESSLSKKDSPVSPVYKRDLQESPVADKKSSSSPVPSKASLRSPVSKKSSTHSTRKGLSYSPVGRKSSSSPSPSKSSVHLSFASKSSSKLPAVKRSSSSKPVVSKASLKEDLYSSKSKKVTDQGKHSSSEKVKERRSSSRYDFDANTEEITAKEIKHGKFKSKALTSSNTSRTSSMNSSAVSNQGRADSPGPNLSMMEIRNSGIPGPGAVTWKRKSVDDSPCGGSGTTSAQMHKNKRRKVERAHQQQQNKPQQKEESFRPDLFGEDDDIYQFDEKDPRLSPKKDPKNRSSKYTVYKYKRDLINRDADAHTPPPATSTPTKPPHSTPPANHKVQSKHNQQQKQAATVRQEADKETNEDKLRQSLIDAKLDLHGADKYIKKKTKRPRQEQWSLLHDDSDTVKPVKSVESKEEEVEDMDVDDKEVVVKSEEVDVKPVAGNIKKSASDDLSSEEQHVLDEGIKKEAKVSANKWYQAFGTSTAITKTSSSIVTNNTPSASVSLPVPSKPAKKEIPKVEKPVNEDDSITDDIDLDDIKPDTSFLEIPPEVRRKARPNFGGPTHFNTDWNRQVRRHHDRCRLPKQLDSSVKLHPASIDGQVTPRRSYEDYARKDMVSPPHLQTLERERLEAKAYTSVSLTTSTADSDMEAKGELPSIVETILMNRKKLRQSFKMGRMYQIPFMKEKKKTRMRMRQAASQASAEDSNMGLLLTPGLPLLTDDTKEVLLGERIQTSSATSFGNFRPYTLNKYLEYGAEAEKPKLYMYGEPELFDSKTRSKANEKVFGPTVAEIFGREFSDKKSSKKDLKKPKKAKEPETSPSTTQDNIVKPILSTAPNKASIDILEKLKEKSVAPTEPTREDDLFAFSQEVGEATEEENNLQSELGGLALDLLDNNPSWQHQVTIQNLVVWEPVEPLPASVKKKKPRKKRSRRSGMDFTPASRRKLAHSKAGGSCDASRASSPLGDEEEDEVHDITYTLDQVVQESMRWVVDKRAGETILQRAAKMGYPDVIAHALSMQGISVKEKDFAGFVPLDKAALKGNHEAVRTLLRFGSDPSSGIKGTKAIHDAVESGSLETLYLLLSYGADPLHHNYSGSMPIDLANITGDKGMQHYLTNLLADLHGKPPPPARGALAALAAPQTVTRWNVTNHTEYHEPEKDPKYLSLCPTLHDDVDSSTSPANQCEEKNSPGELGDMMFEVSSHPLPTEFQFQDREGDFVMYRELKEFAKKFGHHKSDIREKCYIIEIKKSDFLRTARCKSIDRKMNLEVKFHEREGEDSIILVRVDKFVRKIYNSESIEIPR